MTLNRLAVVCMLAVLWLAAPAWAGRSCQERGADAAELQKALDLAYRTRTALEQSGAEVAIVARVGRDLSRHGLRYSHMAFVVRDHPKGRWHLTHMLNHCGTAASALYDEGLGNFFLDDLHDYEALIVTPGRDLQVRLAGLLRSSAAQRLHTASYSLIAHPYSTLHQNSNQWLLEMIAAAVAPPGQIIDRASAQRWLAESGYTAAEIRISPAQRIGARLFSANVRFDDREARELETGRYQVVSAESVAAYLTRADASTERRVLRLH